MKIGIVGLPNVGKSTLFKALTKKQVAASNYPFCTIDPNIGVVEVPDERLEKLTQAYNSKKIIHATIEFVDIAGLVKNASKGEGLGNKFLSHIREVDAIAHVIRNFHNDNVAHIAGKIDPQDDLSTIATELAMADLATVEKALLKLRDKIKSNDKDAEKTYDILKPIKNSLDQGKKPNIENLSKDEYKLIKSLSLLSLKPELFIENIDEKNLNNFKPTIPNSIPICAKLESEIGELNDEDGENYLQELGIQKSGLDKLIAAGYKLLNLITFFTSGPKESHAWPIVDGIKAPQAAGEIHTDFEKGFIRAEIINWNDIVEQNGDIKAKEKGLMRLEGKEYIMQDGDVALFHFN
ncbi:MAG: redox-regulated ATPase YchF [Candidatus Kuenenbacteria bacterium]